METYENLEHFKIRPYRSKRLREYSIRMSSDDNTVIFDDNVADMLRAQGYQIEDAPRSIYSVRKLYEALGKYSPNLSKRIKVDADVRAGIDLAYTCFAKPKSEPYLKVMPLDPNTICTVTSNPNGSAGLTAYGCSKGESMTRALERGVQTLKGEKAPEPCLAFKRTQFNGKTRLVWGYPYAMTAIEGLIAYHLNQKFKRGTTPMAFSIPSGALGTKLRVASYHKKFAYSIDMSAFDASISADLIHIAFSILRTWYDLTELEPITKQPVGKVFDLVERYFIHTPIVMPNSKLYLGKQHGVPSGSFFTQMVDSIVNTIIAGTLSRRFNLHVSKRELFVLGDDLLMWSDRDMSLDVMSKYANSVLGVKMHGSEKSEKFRFDEKIHFLGRDWNKGLPTLNESDVIKRMVFPERFRKYDKDPVKRRKQVHLLILSYASVYWSGWKIAWDLLGEYNWNRQTPEIVDYPAYSTSDREIMDPDYLSGLQRYQWKYVRGKDHEKFTTTALQFWL